MGRLGLEADAVTWAQQRRYGADWFPEAELVPTEGLVEDLRRVKDAGEVARIEAACAIADAALGVVRHRLGEGPTEAEFALELEWQMRRLGADGPSFDTIVASGPNGAKPHHRAGDRRITEGDLVVIDFGALRRRLPLGHDPHPHGRRAQRHPAADARRRAGVPGRRGGGRPSRGRRHATSTRPAGRCMRNAGWGDAFLHGTGHGVGLEIHESPRVSASATASLADGHVVTVEPGVYLAEHGGVRIEDTVVVTAEGCRTLTLAPKEPSL